jgi:cell division protein FtsQ
MPLLQKLSVHVPVVTGFPSAKKLNGRDSLLLDEVKKLALFVISDSFWNAQVGQIDIVGNKNFEIIPTVGNHLIQLGTTENLEQKFNKLFVFYKQVLRNTGFDKYSVINVQYDQQVIGRYKGTTSAIDSIQLQKNIEELMARSAEAREAQLPMIIDSLNKELPTTTLSDTIAAKRTVEKNPVQAATVAKAPSKSNQTINKNKSAVKVVVKKSNGRKPKAVMGKRSSA